MAQPLTANRRLLSFLVRFARNSTMPRWQQGMKALVPINSMALEVFDTLRDGGVSEPTHAADPFIAAFRTPRERARLLEEIEHMHATGQPLEYDVLTGEEARAMEPALSPAIGAAIRLRGQRYLTPSGYMDALAEAVREHGARMVSGVQVDAIKDRGSEVIVAGEAYDAVVIASGAWLSTLARPFGVKTPVQAGRGYSFTIPIDPIPVGPIYFPSQRVVCTPAGDRLRIAGMMEFRPADAGLDTRWIEAIVDAARPLLRGAELGSRRDEWVGARPCTPDGLPLIGATKSERVYVGGGHGMWGITLGPATGQLLAERMVTGVLPHQLRPFDPLR